MGWRTVVVTQHAKVSYTSRQLVVQTKDGISEIPVSDIQVLLISTLSAVVTTAAINALIQNNAKIIFTGKNGQPVCETVGYYPGTRDAGLLVDQFNWPQNRKDILWTKIVSQKILMQIQVCEYLEKGSTDLADEFSKLEIGDVTNREAVIARKYFSLVFNSKFVRHGFDPINAALNYGYSILLSAIDREVVTNGYLTQLGVHHHNEGNEFNLGSDLMEPFRPVIDFWVAHQKFKELTPDIKFGLVDLLNYEVKYNGEITILRNALTKHVAACLNYLSVNRDDIEIKVELTDEVPNNAINGHV
ncbi:type II CRISPR-associated endonuclease Cas1 [Paucilactobacillus kaifaensis]|uniref:type II CRISPR-associated endonuclease Cas1 n=1 Tax=Paucilactobacillus kaifaensis TaxID=2559921 RepID=UPI0010F526E4|nr:type II CRISPR-associated endonuclease Cas1 [Paucilactobacillus kaifaensis]